jgi:hypothetical protein
MHCSVPAKRGLHRTLIVCTRLTIVLFIQIKHALEEMYKRVQRNVVAENLLVVVWRNISAEFMSLFSRFTERITKCYGEAQIKLEFDQADLEAYFDAIAKANP